MPMAQMNSRLSTIKWVILRAFDLFDNFIDGVLVVRDTDLYAHLGKLFRLFNL